MRPILRRGTVGHDSIGGGLTLTAGVRVPEVATTRGGETVLLVEDDAAVRVVAQKALARLGYRVLAAEGGEGAIRMAREHEGAIHLLLTDVMMPGLNGVQVARIVQRLRPGIQVFFMSGYADQDLIRQGLLDPRTHFVQKPFTPRELGREVREALDRGAPGNRSGASPLPPL